jgi:SWI/SNF-related matrix-associated actin-dependent regulator of chromatin subfamily A member 5
MQELSINYGNQKQKVYSEDEDRYLLCRLSHYGLNADDVYEKIKRDISEFPVFRFDWFFKSRTPLELQRRCQQLLMLISKEKGGGSYYDDDDFAEEGTSRTKSGTKVRIVNILPLLIAG